MESQEERPLLFVGGSLYVCLPKFWTKYHRLVKGDRVQVQITDNDITIKPKKRLAPSDKELEKTGRFKNDM